MLWFLEDPYFLNPWMNVYDIVLLLDTGPKFYKLVICLKFL